MKKVAFYTLGCKLNFAETSTIARSFEEDGYIRVDFDDPADIYVINTCSVTENADKQFKQIVRKALKTNPKAFLAAVGCYAQLKPEELASVDGVDLVLGAKEKFNITQYIDDLTKNNEGVVHSCEIAETDFYVGSYSIGDRTRAFLKVQDGCDYKCTYCTIPMARGISRSDTIENILSNAKKISDKGIKEIVLTGVNIGDYGKGEFGNKKHEHTFLELVQALDKVNQKLNLGFKDQVHIKKGEKGFFINFKDNKTNEIKSFALFNIAQVNDPQKIRDYAAVREYEYREAVKQKMTEAGKEYVPYSTKKEGGIIKCSSTKPEEYIGQYLAAVSSGSQFKVSEAQAESFKKNTELFLFEKSENGSINPFKLNILSAQANKYCKDFLPTINQKQPEQAAPRPQQAPKQEMEMCF